MLSVNLGSSSSVGFQAATPQTTAANAAAESTTPGGAPQGVKVNLSGAGIAKSAAAKSSSDDSSTDPVKTLEKRIKEIQKEMAKVQQQLQAIESNKSLTADQRQAQAGAVQAQLTQLSAALSTATASLSKLLEKQTQSAASGGSAG